MLELSLGFGWVVDLGGARACDPVPSPASLSVDAWHIRGVAGCMWEGCRRYALVRSSGLGSVGDGRGLADGVLVDFECIHVV
jgi:hypothetical protein